MAVFKLEKKYACITVDQGDAEPSNVTIYAESPDTTALQIRTYGSVAASGKGVKRVAYSHVSLTADDLAAVIAELTAQRDRLLAKQGPDARRP